MSLTSFLKRKEIREGFKQFFPKFSQIDLGDILVAPYKQRNDLVGIAFDYLFRFYAKRINDNVWEQEWFPEKILLNSCVSPLCGISISGMYGSTILNEKQDQDEEFVERCINKFRKSERKFIRNGKWNYLLLYRALRVAQFELIARSGIYLGKFFDIEDGDIAQLKKLTQLLKIEHIKCSRQVLLNPSFGEFSKMIGGADADVVCDDTILEIKTVNGTQRIREYLSQLLGYYALSVHGGIDGNSLAIPINKIGIYFSRYGKRIDFDIVQLAGTKENLKNYVEWFGDAVKNIIPKYSNP